MRERRAALRAGADARHHLIDEITDLNAALHARQRKRQADEDGRVALVAPLLILGLGLVFGGAAFVVARRERARVREQQRYRARQERFGEAMQAAESQVEAHRLLKAHLERSLSGASATVLNRNNSADRLEATTPLAADSPLGGAPAAGDPALLPCRAPEPAIRTGEPGRGLRVRSVRWLADGTTCQPLLVGGEVIGSVLTERLPHRRHVTRSGSRNPSRRPPGAREPAQPCDRGDPSSNRRAPGLPNRRAVDDTLLRMLAQAGRTFEPLSASSCSTSTTSRRSTTPLDTIVVTRCWQGSRDACARRSARATSPGAAAARSSCSSWPAPTAPGRQGRREGAGGAAEPARGGVERNITASFGIACFPDDAVEAPALMRSADRALYVAKRAGRDRIESSSTGAAASAEDPQFPRITQ